MGAGTTSVYREKKKYQGANNQAMKSLLLLLLQLSRIVSLQLPSSCHSRRFLRDLKLQVVNGENSVALNNFIANVLRAKDELKWIDRAVSARDASYKSHRSRRRLLWSMGAKNQRSRYKRLHTITDHSNDKSFDNVSDRAVADEVDIETILDDLGFSGENSPGSRGMEKNPDAERRRYPIIDLTGTGIIEYYDYGAVVEKRSSRGSFNSTDATAMSDQLRSVGDEDIAEDKSMETPGRSYSEGSFGHGNGRPEARQFGIGDIEDRRTRQSDRCHSAGSRERTDTFVNSPSAKVQLYEEILPKSVHNADRENSQIMKNVNSDGACFKISLVNLSGGNNSMTPGDKYNVLKGADDGVKSGTARKSSSKKSASTRSNSEGIGNVNHWKSIQGKNQGAKASAVSICQYEDEGSYRICESTVAENMPERSKESREMRRRSTLESSNWERTDYKNHDNTKMRFGRKLMQASTTDLMATESADTSLTSKTRHEDTIQAFKLIPDPTALAYLRGRGHKPLLKRNEIFIHNHSTHFEPTKRVKRNLNGMLRMGRFIDNFGPENLKDESQIVLALHGEMAKKIVDRIFEQVQKNEPLMSTLGSHLYRRYKTNQELTGNQPETSDSEETKHTEEIMKKVREFLLRLVSSEVHRKSCTKLPPHLHKFLVWIVGDGEESRDTMESPVSPMNDKHRKEEDSKLNKFLFLSTLQPESNTVNPNDLRRKVRLLKTLIKEYHALTEKEQTKVQAVHDYLERQLHLLLRYIELKEKTEKYGEGAVYDRPLAPKSSKNDNERRKLRLESRSLRNRRRRQVGSYRNDGKLRKSRRNKKNSRHKRKKQFESGITKQYLRSRRSAIEDADQLHWEIPRIFRPDDIKFLSNVSTHYDPSASSTQQVPTMDDGLERLFKDTRVSKFIPEKDIYSSKSAVSTTQIVQSSPTLNVNSKFSTNSTSSNSSTTAPAEAAIKNKHDMELGKSNPRNLSSIQDKINVFQVT